MRTPRSSLLAVIALVIAPAILGAAPSFATRVLVIDVKADRPADSELAAALTRVIESDVIRAAPDVEVMTWRAVATTLETAEVADCLGDKETAACASEIGGALGVDLIVSPHVGALGSVRVLTVSVYRMGNATVAAQATRRTAMDDDSALLDAAGSAVVEALSAAGLRVVAPSRLSALQVVPSDTVQADASAAEPSPFPLILLGTGVTTGALVALAGAALHAGVFLAWAQPYERGELDREGARAWEREAPMWWTLPWLAYAGGATLIAGGLVGGWVLHE